MPDVTCKSATLGVNVPPGTCVKHAAPTDPQCTSCPQLTDSTWGSIVTAPSDAARADAEADIIVPSEASEAPGTRLRHTVSLGFIGGGKLTETPSYGGYEDGGVYYPATPYYGHGGHGGR